MKRLNHSGFSQMIIFVAVAVFLALSIVAYRAVSSNQPASDNATGSVVPSSIRTKADLTAASKALDTTDENAVNPDQFDADLDALL